MAMKKISLLIASVLTLVSLHGSAYHHLSNPKGCINEGFEFIHGHISLIPAKKKSIFMFANTSGSHIQLQLYAEPKALYPKKMISHLYANQWSALSTMDAEKLQLQCQHVSKHGISQTINCASVLHICQYTKVKFGENNAGTYWVIQNQPRAHIVSATIAKGILLR